MCLRTRDRSGSMKTTKNSFHVGCFQIPVCVASVNDYILCGLKEILIGQPLNNYLLGKYELSYSGKSLVILNLTNYAGV